MAEVRQLTESDFDAFHALRLHSLKEHPESFLLDYDELNEWPLERVRRFFLQRTWFGAFDGDRIVGYTGLSRYEGVKVAHKATVGGVYVHADYRGQGIARAMILQAIDKAKLMGIELLHLGANNEHPATIGLYKSLGFEQYGIEKHITKLADGRYVDDMLMVKFLK